MVRSTVYDDAIHAYVANTTAQDAIVLAAGNLDAIAGASFHRKIANRDMRSLAQSDHRRGKGREDNTGLRKRAGWPEIKPAAFASDEIFSGLIQFLKQVHRQVTARAGISAAQTVIMLLR